MKFFMQLTSEWSGNDAVWWRKGRCGYTSTALFPTLSEHTE